MKHEDIIRLAIEHTIHGLKFDEDGLVRFANLVAQHEREACAKVCDSLEEQCEKLLVPDEKWPTPADCANIIRVRGKA